MYQPISRVVDLLEPNVNRIVNMDLDEARRRVFSGDADAVRAIGGSFAIVAAEGTTARLARSMDRPLRYFWRSAMRAQRCTSRTGSTRFSGRSVKTAWAVSFTLSYTRMVPALRGRACPRGMPRPDPTYTRFSPARAVLPADLDEIGTRTSVPWLAKSRRGSRDRSQ
jgi:asparagine synthase (glutamine-hydrolysing)